MGHKGTFQLCQSLVNILYKETAVKTEKECLDYLSQVNTPRLSPEETSLCEGKLSLQGCRDALNSIKMGKAQGTMD